MADAIPRLPPPPSTAARTHRGHTYGGKCSSDGDISPALPLAVLEAERRGCLRSPGAPFSPSSGGVGAGAGSSSTIEGGGKGGGVGSLASSAAAARAAATAAGSLVR